MQQPRPANYNRNGGRALPTKIVIMLVRDKSSELTHATRGHHLPLTWILKGMFAADVMSTRMVGYEWKPVARDAPLFLGLKCIRDKSRIEPFRASARNETPYISMSRTPDRSLVSRSKIQKKATQMSGFFLPVSCARNVERRGMGNSSPCSSGNLVFGAPAIGSAFSVRPGITPFLTLMVLSEGQHYSVFAAIKAFTSPYVWAFKV